MTWTTPKTWVTGEPLTASDMNTHLRDNLEALKNPPSAQVTLNQASDYTTTATSFVDVDSGVLSLTISTHGGDVMVAFHGNVGATSRVYLNITADGVPIAGDDGIASNTGTGDNTLFSFVRLVTGLAPGPHTFRLQWKVNSGTATLYAGAGTANWDVHPQFWAREVS